jgi:hypothetical protein
MRKPFAMNTVTSLRALLLSSVALAMISATALAEGDGDCVPGTGCTVKINGLPADEVAPNTETAIEAPDGDGFSLSVDGEVIAGSETLADKQRDADVDLREADIQVKYDGLDVRPMLNVSTVPAKETYEPGETLEFRVALNYAAWITRAEVIISQFEGARSGVIARVPADNTGTGNWQVPEGITSKLAYVLRVYDSEGRYDETLPRPLTAIDERPSARNEALNDGPKATPGTNEDNTALRNIPVQGGAVTIYGRGIQKDGEVYALGESVPVDPEGNFLIQRILPPGDHAVDVAVRGGEDGNMDFSRQINIPDNDWFYVGLADFTLGKRFGNKDMKAAYPGEFNGVYNKGRLAFYLKGKIKGSTLLTAALDTGEHDVLNILKRIDEKDPRRFLKRIDPDDYYPVYGDDSTTIEDAPTSGHFYVKLQRDDSHVMWGNYKAYINGNKFLTNQRALYGAQGVYKSKRVMLDGSRSTEVSAHAAQPGTLTQNDTLRGTGGSAYFLKHQDIATGSETVSIELRDPVTGFVVSKTTLKIGVGYEFDYSQGVVILTSPLLSTRDGRHQYLVVNYEFTPATTEVKGYAVGGRAQQWVGDHVRVGATVMRDYSGEANLTMGGADVRFQATEDTYLDLHVAQSRGRGFGYSASSDGGITYTDIAPAAGGRKRANAYGAEARTALEDVTGGRLKGDLQAQYSWKQGGFSTLDSQVTERKEDIRIASRVELSGKTSLNMEGTQSRSPGKTDRELKAIVSRTLTDKATVDVYAKDTQKSGTTTTTGEKGHRLDVGSKVTHQVDEDTAAWVFGQATVLRGKDRRRDHRVGVGGKTALSEKIAVEGEISGGSEGLGGLAKVTFTPTADTKYYVGYELDAYRDLDTSLGSTLTGDDLGHFIFGGRQKVTEELSFFVEDSYDLFGLKRTLAQTYGVDYAPHEHWSIGAAVELGHVYDSTVTDYDFDRKAASLSVAYRNPNGNAARLKGEARRDASTDPLKGDLDAYLLEGTVDWRANENWRLLANLDAVFTDATVTTRDGDYVEASLGYAYRPIEDDKLNALFKYTYLYDLPGTDQVTVDGTTNGDYQRSHILSADFIYDLTDIVSVGAKYGMRYGQTRPRAGGVWVDNIAHLAVARADINVARAWDVLLEGRMLWSPTSDSTQLGVLAALYRHMGDNFKVGVGYNFGRFSDDLADLTADDHGVFINAVGKF